MIFFNPAGAPELACDACGCRWFDRLAGACNCYECGTPVSADSQAEYRRALETFALRRGLDTDGR
ncbi:MAG: hypothetical protein ACYC7B_05010 [Burkholderiales bacterium]